MPGFIRVRAVKGPKHEFHAPAEEVAVNPSLYQIIDKTPVDAPEPPKYIVTEPSHEKTVGNPKKEN
jgi:hypothetical protein